MGFIVFPIFYFHIKSINQSHSYLYYVINGLFFSFGLFSLYLIWIKNPFLLNEISKNYSYISFLLIFVISLIFGLLFILFKYFKSLRYDIILVPLIFTIFEMIIGNLWHGFPWISFALIISNNFLGSILLSIFGSYGTSFILINIFLIPAYYLKYKKFFNKSNNKILLLIFFVSIIIIFSLNKIHINKIHEKNLDVDLVQLNFSVSDNISSQKKFIEITKIIETSKADLIIFGENNFPFVLKDINKTGLEKYLKPNQKVIIGATRKDDNKYYNSLIFITKNQISFFDKKILVPFGEFVPFREYISFMNIIAGSIDYSKGSQPRYIEIDNIKNFIPVICYEIIFFWQLINKQNNQSDIIVNITNDSWFGNLIGPYQHFYLTKMRSAEFKKPLIRVSNNGISGIFDQNGRIVKHTTLNRKEILNFNIKIANERNLIYFHQIINLLIVFFFFSIFIFQIINGKRYS